jgi:acylphosphatase
MTARVHVVVHGDVQGVWYRGSMQREARRLGVGGWVRNNFDGTVEAELEGDPAAVEALVAWSRHGPSLARVTRVEVDRLPPPAAPRSTFDVVG